MFVDKFFYNGDLKNINEVEMILKKVLRLFNYKYNISFNGLFDVDIFLNKKVGMFINFKKNNSILFSKNTDLKINIINNCDFYFKTLDFEIIEDLNEIYYNEGYYYVNIDKLCNLDNYIEFGDFLYSSKIKIEREFIRIK